MRRRNSSVLKIPASLVLQKINDVFGTARNIICQGGARASKTYSIAQKIILCCLERPGRIVTIMRKTFPALRASVMRDFFDILNNLGIYEPQKHNKTNPEYILNDNLVEFVALDQQQKVRGRKRDIAWLNEANEFEYADYFQIALRTSEKIFLDYNPSDEYSWIYEKIIPRADSAFIKATYQDNPFLPSSLRREIESLKDEDEYLWKVYGLGEKARAKNIIYPNWEIVQDFPECDFLRYGLDFGFNHPSVCLQVGILGGDVYIDEIIYQTRLTNSDFIDLMKAEKVRTDNLIRADSAEPDRIEEIALAGFWIEGAKKGKDSVKNGIDNVKRRKLYITRRSVNVLKEIKNYKWREGKDGGILDEPVPFNDHAMSALRYAVGDIVADQYLYLHKKKEINDEEYAAGDFQGRGVLVFPEPDELSFAGY